MVESRQLNASVTCGCVTNYPKTEPLTTTGVYLLIVLWFGSLGWVQLDSSAGVSGSHVPAVG